jgi:HTH-type transcriptional regulator, sugar sensing transcriptional regulator
LNAKSTIREEEMTRADVIRSLQELGFSEYEAKCYIALLGEQSQTGYSVARASGVPRSKVYEVLEGLVARGVVIANHGEPTQYAPLSPQELIALRRRETEQSINSAEEGLKQFASSGVNRDLIWDIKGRNEILDRLREVIGRTRRLLLLQLWAEDAPELRDALADAAERGVQIVIIAYDEPHLPFAQVYLHEPGAEEVTREHGGRWIILSADASEVVAGIVSLGYESRAAWTAHPGLVMPITEEIKHDLYIAELLAAHRDVLEASFGPGLRKLRDRFVQSPRTSFEVNGR